MEANPLGHEKTRVETGATYRPAYPGHCLMRLRRLWRRRCRFGIFRERPTNRRAESEFEHGLPRPNVAPAVPCALKPSAVVDFPGSRGFPEIRATYVARARLIAPEIRPHRFR